MFGEPFLNDFISSHTKQPCTFQALLRLTTLRILAQSHFIHHRKKKKKQRLYCRLGTKIFSLNLCHNRERASGNEHSRSIFLLLRSEGRSMHQAGSQSCSLSAAAGVFFVFVGSPEMNGNGIIAVWVYVLFYSI